MSTAVLPPSDDWIFKLLFGDERNKSILISLLQSFLDLPQEEYELSFIDTHLKRGGKGEKMGILDIKVRTKTGKVIDIEIQVNPTTNIGKRLSFYKSKLIADQIGKSEHYTKIQRVICVCITNHTLFRDVPGYLNKFRFCNLENGLCFEDIPEEIYTLELPKLPSESDGTALWEWLWFLRCRAKEEFEMVATRNPEIRKAVEILYELSADEKVRAQYEHNMKAWRDYMSEHDGAFENGMERGMEKGMEKGVKQVAVNALAEGMSIEFIQKITGLGVEDIAKLKASL